MIEVHILMALQDNYVYVLCDPESQQVAVVDPSEAMPVIQFLQKKKWPLHFIFNTHHHYDHVGGNLELQKLYKCEIYCSECDRSRVPGATRGLKDNEQIHLGKTLMQVFAVPGHTLGAISFYCPSEHLLFTGDTLFTSGCGRLFEGTARELWHSLKSIAALPPKTKVYSGHEYGLQNAAFAKKMFPLDLEIARRFESIAKSRHMGQATVQTTLEQELMTNPFLKAQNLAEFTDLRHAKDDFRLEDSTSMR